MSTQLAQPAQAPVGFRSTLEQKVVSAESADSAEIPPKTGDNGFSANSRESSCSESVQLDIRPDSGGKSLRHADTDERWEAALKRAQDAGIQAFRVTKGGIFAVTSATDPTIAYIVNAQLSRCTCPAAQGGDPICLHRALVRSIVNPPQPEPPAHKAYDPIAEQLQWALNDRARAWKDLENWNARIERGDVLNDREWAAFLNAQLREQDAHDRIVAFSAQTAMVAA